MKSEDEALQKFAIDLLPVLKKHKVSVEGYSNFQSTIFPLRIRLQGMREPFDIDYICNGTNDVLERLVNTKRKKSKTPKLA